MIYMKYECQTWNGEENKILGVFRIINLRQITIHLKFLMSNMK